VYRLSMCPLDWGFDPFFPTVRRCAQLPECKSPTRCPRADAGSRARPGSRTAYGQLAEIIFNDFTSTDGRFDLPAVVAPVAPAVVPPAVAVEPVVPEVVAAPDIRGFMLASHIVWPETATLCPMCLSMSVPPVSTHDMAFAAIDAPPDPDVVAPAVVAPAVVPPAVVAPEVVPPVVAPAVLAVVDVPIGSTIALVSMYRPSAAFATHPVTVTSRPEPSAAPLRCVVADEVELCAPSEITQLHTLAMHSPVILRVIRWPSCE